MSGLEFEEAFCQSVMDRLIITLSVVMNISFKLKALSLDPAPDIEMEKKDKLGETIEETWHIFSDEPVRRIKWCSLKVVEETTRKMHMFFGGTFERINPLEYCGKNELTKERRLFVTPLLFQQI